MKTLKELIAEGLPVGALVSVYENGNGTEFQWNGEIFTCVSAPDPWYQFGDTVLEEMYNYIEAEPTTAYDSDIDPETLPIPEPFWTGWVVCDGYKFNPVDYGDNGSKIFEDGWHQEYLKSDCQPCLPPK